MIVLINSTDYTQYVQQASIDIEAKLSDPVPTCEFILEDPGATFPIDCLQDVVLIDDANNYANTTHNIIQDPTFTLNGSKWSPHIPQGSIAYNSGAGTATISVNTASTFDNISLTQTTRPFAVLGSSTYMLSLTYSIASLSHANVTITRTILNNDGSSISNIDTFSANTSGNTTYTAAITTSPNTIAIQVSIALNRVSSTTVGTLVITQPQLELEMPSSGLSYPTPPCIPGATNCTTLPDLTVVRQNRIFGGLTVTPKVTYDGPNRIFDIKCAGYAILLSKIYVTSNYVNANDDDIIRDLVNTYGAGYFTANNVITLPSANYDQVSWQDITLKDAFGTIAGATGTNYFVDAYGAVHYQFPGYSQSNIRLSNNPDYNLTFPYYDYEYTKDASEMANRIKVNGGGNTQNQQIQAALTETFSGNGSNKTFTLGNLPRAVNSVTVGGTAQKVGTDLKDGFADGYAVLVNKSNQTINFNTAPASGTNNVVVTYTYLAPPSIRISDASSIGKYGVTLDAKLDDSAMVSSADTYRRGLTELAQYSTPLRSATLKTNYGPWTVGDTVGFTSTFDGLSGTPFLIQSVKQTVLGVDQTSAPVYEYYLEIGAYRPDFIHHMTHLQKKVKHQSSNTSVAAKEYVVAFDQINYLETIAGSLYTGTIPGGGSPPSTTYITDTFEGRTVSGGWGTASDNTNVWSINTLSNVNLSVSSGFGQAQWNGNGGSSTSAFVEMFCGPSQPANVDILVQFRGLNNFNNGRTIGAWTRLNPGVSSYFAAAVLGNSGSVFNVQKQVSGLYTTIGSFNISVSPNQLAWFRFTTSGTFIAAKFWLDSDSEPTNWGWSGTDSSVSSSGRVGIRVGTPGQVGPVQIGDFVVTAA